MSSQTYLFNSSYNIDPSSMATRHLKICVSLAEKYIISNPIKVLCLMFDYYKDYKSNTES